MSQVESIDLANELEYFQSTKAGVKGLVDSGITKVPKMFIHPKEETAEPSELGPNEAFEIPIIDFTSINDIQEHSEISDKVYEASASFGFFQLVNHGIPESVLDAILEGSRAFHEGDLEIKSKLYTADQLSRVRFFSNSRLYKPAFGVWLDSFLCDFDGSLDVNEIPVTCRDASIQYREHLVHLSQTICELLSESLGLNKDHLGRINVIQRQFMLCHYYPPCPEPELAMGTQKHRDPCFLTILLQDSIGGLQICYQGRWIDVKPVRGALLVNIGDLLQLVSNDKLKSVEHRVLANKTNEPRLSVVTFFNPRNEEEKPYGPIRELLSEENCPIYRDVLFRDYMNHQAQGISSNALDKFKL